MTAGFWNAARDREGEARELPRSPAEGWLPLGLLLVMLVAIALAVDEARWAGIGTGNSSQTAFLLWAVVLSALWGFVSAKSELSPIRAHVIGALLATPFLLLAISGVLTGSQDLPVRIEALNESLRRFHHDLFIEGIRSQETTVFLLGLGIVAWATGQFSAFAIYRRHRPLDAVFVTGLLMLTEVSATILVQYNYLLIFTAAALLLVVRMNLFAQRMAWARRRIGDTGDLSAVYMRSGLTFVVFALLGSMFLAATASSAPLASIWRGRDRDLVRIGSELNRIVGGVSGAAKGPSGLFGASQTIRGVWESSSAPVFRAVTSDGAGHYWRAATYDGFDGTSWLQLERSEFAAVEPGAPLLSATTEAVSPGPGRLRVEARVTAFDLGDILLAPESPLTVDRRAAVFTNSAGGPLASIEAADGLIGGDSYTLTALVRAQGEENGGLTANQLAAAGVNYPAWTRRYVEIRPNSIGPLTYQTAERIVAALPRNQRDPYHVAQAIQDYLYSDGGFEYSTDVRGMCASERLVDCFLREKVGYCEYFATSMVMLLRTQQIPARLAMGYLPGRRLADGSWEVDRSAAHAWAEVYFPRYGWVRFDPTPGNRENGQRPARLEAGAPVPSPSAGAAGDDATTPQFGEGRSDDERERGADASADPAAAPAETSQDQPGNAAATVLVMLSLLLGGAALLAWAYLRRAPPPAPDLAYRGVARLAGRFGYGPRPTQTAYEYAGSLGELVPRVRTDLEVVARAKVQATYAARPAADDLLAGLRDAYRRVRVGLLRLAVRRARRGRRDAFSR